MTQELYGLTRDSQRKWTGSRGHLYRSAVKTTKGVTYTQRERERERETKSDATGRCGLSSETQEDVHGQRDCHINVFRRR